MFKKFTPKEDVASNTVLKSSSQRAIRTKLVSQYPLLSRLAPPSPDDAPATVATPAKKGKKGGKGQPEEAVEEEGEQVVTVLDRIWPKKESLFLVKCRDHVSVLTLHGLPLFFQSFDGPYFPTLKLLHQYPDLLPPVRVDRGAIKFVLSGANIMCPGLTSPGAKLPSPTPDIPSSDTPVAVLAEDKEEACAVGLLKMASEEMRRVNKGIGVENVHWLGDDLWVLDKI